ncbi:hypothetical protein [Crocinitomix algicola]|uniref:hypothetical protein n=1 Tax=Crocinitomix algicola TaxID=1740263 RepID=UPI001112EA1B|nr:hypothetical protein [Crocinitomix algicola]
MKLLYIILVSIFASEISAQNTIDYYEGINVGKIFAIQNDFESAINSYHQVFIHNDFVFARDCINAIEFSILAKDSVKIEYFIERAISQGIKITDIEKSYNLTDYLKSNVYNEIKEKEDSLYRVYTSRINWEIREEVNQMFSEDQKLREEYYAANVFQKNKVRKRWETLNSEQVERLIEITKQYGFPGEKLIGLDRSEMHSKIRTNNYSAGMPIVIFIHHFSQPNLSYDSLLIDEVKKGNLYNEHFGTICDFEAEFGKSRHENFGYYGLRFQPKKIDPIMLNKKRKKIGVLEFEQVEQLNNIKEISKFWNRLY